MYEELFAQDKVVPVVVLKTIGDALPTVSAISRGGIQTAEITFRTSCAAEAISLCREHFPDMTIGAGTVISGEQCENAILSGAQFIVGPGLSPDVAKICLAAHIPYFPGCVTPTEIMAAMSFGYDIVKFFPAGAYGGLKTIKALAGPFPHVKFMPTGGVDFSNLREFLQSDKVAAIGGSFMMKGDIEANCREIVRIVNEYRS